MQKKKKSNGMGEFGQYAVNKKPTKREIAIGTSTELAIILFCFICK